MPSTAPKASSGVALYHGTISGSFKNALDWLELLQHRNPPTSPIRLWGSSARLAESRGCKP
jgi:NAD(P)H-dependent FMN reductase